MFEKGEKKLPNSRSTDDVTTCVPITVAGSGSLIYIHRYLYVICLVYHMYVHRSDKGGWLLVRSHGMCVCVCVCACVCVCTPAPKAVQRADARGCSHHGV